MPLAAVLCPQWQCALVVECRRLIHVVPYARYAFLDVGQMEVAPPLAHFGSCEVGPHCRVGPHLANPLFISAILHKGSKRLAALIYMISSLLLDPWIDYGYRSHMVLLPHVVSEALHVRKTMLVEGEDFEAVHIVNVHPNGVQRQIQGTVTLDYRAYSLLIGVAPSALMIPQGPQRGQKRPPCQCPKQRHYIGWMRSRDQIKVESWPITPDVGAIGLCIGQVICSSPSLVKEHPPCHRFF
mmetsp:Transcript_15535/g.25701  ORF Transcript_15535/g.25701 Transcript_15535/m.25701 type:complete len:240 (-) Transcript_15535:801-1520(-)